MAQPAGLYIRVTAARGSLTIRYSSKGRYVSLPVNDLTNQMLGVHLVSGSGS